MKYSSEIIADFFTNADWDYSYNSERIKEGDMQDMCGELSNHIFTVDEVQKAINCLDPVDINAFESQKETNDINIYI